jgi:MoaA/NifB/PqqE/SkfB family radical SAM enzyme
MYTDTPPNSFELELTTKCNASCPQCSRNYYGGAVWENLPMVDLELNWLKEKFTIDFLQTVKTIRLVGTYGDPCMHKDLISIVQWLHASTKAAIIISTNGSLRTTKWWHELGSTMENDDRVIFGVDGLADTNHLYRKGTNFKKIINNLKAFNSAGGHSIWSFIAFKHNEHQVEDARKMSQELGCIGFAVKTTVRFIDKQHNMIEKFPVMNRRKKIVYWLEPPTTPEYINPGYKSYEQNQVKYNNYSNYLKSTNISCDAKNNRYFYVSAEGYVFPCGWLLDRMYGYEAEKHPDRARMLDMIQQHGGLNSINLNYTKLEDILHGKFFQAVAKSWKDESRLDRCANQCGVDSHSITASYHYLKKILPQ